MTTRSAPREIALLNKLEDLSVIPRRQIHLRSFDFSRYPVLSWYHGVIRRGRHYSMQCDVQADGSLAVSWPVVGLNMIASAYRCGGRGCL